MSLVWSYDVHTTYYYTYIYIYIHVFIINVTPLKKNTHPYKSHSHIKTDFIPLRMTTNTRHGSTSNPSTCVHVNTASRGHAFTSGLLATTVSKTPRGPSTLSKRPLTTPVSKTKIGHENIFGRSVRYTRYTLYRVTLFCNKKPRTDHVALSAI